MEYTIKRTLYKSTRYVIEFFMYSPKVAEHNSNYNIQTNPILSIRQMNSESYQEDFKTIQERSFKITPRNYYKTLKFFNNVVTWFYDDKMHDLYVYNDDDELVFNSDYNSLYLVTQKGINEQNQMKAMPTVVQFNDKKYEGIHLYVNKPSNLIILTKDEVEMVLGLLKDFSFQTEILASLMMVENAKANGNVNVASGNYGSYNSKKSPFD